MAYQQYAQELPYKYDISVLKHAPQPLEQILTSVPPHAEGEKFAYGTAGFRGKGEKLYSVAYRTGIVATLRSLSFERFKAIGLMITASHNPAPDNGFKIIDPSGGMLDMNWESIATDITNAAVSDLPTHFNAIIASHSPSPNQTAFAEFFASPFPDKIDDNLVEFTNPQDIHWNVFNNYPNRPIIMLGYDNRPSSIQIMANIKAICLSLGCIVVNYHLSSTPQIHWFVGKFNQLDTRSAENALFPTYNLAPTSFPTHAMYTNTLAQAFLSLYQAHLYKNNTQSSPSANCTPTTTSLQFLPDPFTPTTTENPRVAPTNDHIIVDVAHGVGFFAFFPIIQYFNDTHLAHPQLTTILNPSDTDPVNQQAGIDYALRSTALKEPIPSILNDPLCYISPPTLPPSLIGKQEVGNQPDLPKCPIQPENRSLWSVDGDCDRAGAILTYSKPDGSKAVGFLDGDRLLVLFVEFFTILLHRTYNVPEITISAVQTAYSNGASQKYLKDTYGNDVVLQKACTGVKHLIAKTSTHDICVYFEQNGHGSVCFNQSLFDKLDSKIAAADDEAAKEQLLRLKSTLFLCQQLITPFIGDACGDILFAVICILKLGRSIEDVYKMYTNFHTRNAVVKVADKSVIIPDPILAEERLITPIALQTEIDELAQQHQQYNLRCFVRPSGTEDVVRICVESSDLDVTERILQQMVTIVPKYAGFVEHQDVGH